MTTEQERFAKVIAEVCAGMVEASISPAATPEPIQFHVQLVAQVLRMLPGAELIEMAELLMCPEEEAQP